MDAPGRIAERSACLGLIAVRAVCTMLKSRQMPKAIAKQHARTESGGGIGLRLPHRLGYEEWKEAAYTYCVRNLATCTAAKLQMQKLLCT
eukprot:2738411-Amphidinium_carterae.1